MPASVSKHPRRWSVFAASAVACMLVAATVFFIATRNPGNAPAVAQPVTLVPSRTPGPNPFTESVASGAPGAATQAVVAKSAALRRTLPTDRDTHLLVATGTVPGLYGGSRQLHVCDPPKLVSYLKAHQDKAAAWAGVEGIESVGIGTFVAALTPVLLNSDTLVGNHGYLDGKALPHPTVLQAGTAVLVDATGTPRVQCNCGNPLTPPVLLDLGTATTTGPAWPDYSPAAVTVIKPGTASARLTLVDVTNGTTYQAGPGSDTGLWAAASVDTAQPVPWTSTITTSTDGRTWTMASAIHGESVYQLAYGNGIWLAAASRPWETGRTIPPTQLFESTDLRSWSQVASLADHVSGLSYGSGSWVATGYGVSMGTGTLAWQSTDATHWGVAATTLGEGGPGVQHLAARGHGNGQWLGVVADPAPPAATFAAALPAPLDWTSTSTDGRTWKKLVPLPGKATGAAVAYGAGTWLVAENKWVPGSPGTNQASVALSRDGTTWAVDPATGIGTNSFTAAGYGNGTWMAATIPSPGSGSSVAAMDSATFFTSTDAKKWSPAATLPHTVQALAFGAVQAALQATPAPSPSGTASPPASGTASPAPGIGGSLANGNYSLAVARDVSCHASTLNGAVLTVRTDTSSLVTTTGTRFNGQVVRQGTSGFTIEQVTTADGSGNVLGIKLEGGTVADGSLSGQGYEGRGAVRGPGAGQAQPDCHFTFTAAPAHAAPVHPAGPSPTPSPAPPPSPSASPAGSCTPGTVLGVVNAHQPASKALTVSAQDIRCSGSWITAGVNDPANRAQYTVLLHRVNGIWTRVDRQAACTANQVPADIRQLACNSN